MRLSSWTSPRRDDKEHLELILEPWKLTLNSFVEAHSGVVGYAHPGVVETHPSRLRNSCGYWRNFADFLKGQGQYI